jgi:hypothetical protein
MYNLILGTVLFFSHQNIHFTHGKYVNDRSARQQTGKDTKTPKPIPIVWFKLAGTIVMSFSVIRKCFDVVFANDTKDLRAVSFTLAL